jgi:hypothetical protein
MKIQRVATTALLMATCALARAQDLAAGFRDPPREAAPHTWWHWMNGNITREGITADLEAMKQIGLGGAQIFNVSESIPDGPVGVMSPQWRELVVHAAKEADRLGIELCMHNCAGWSSSGGPWITPENSMQIVVFSEAKASGPSKVAKALPKPEARQGYYADIAVLAFPTPKDDARRIPDIAPKAGFDARYGMHPDLTSYPAECVISKSAIVDITSKLGADGTLTWDVPAGDWTILRIGHTTTGKTNHPAPASGTGLEVDKLSRAAFDTHWAGMMGPVLKDLGPLAGKVLNNALVDSYEVGAQNWTPLFREEFTRRRGYDPLPWMVAMTGRVVDGGEASERFLWDFRRTIGDLFADNYFGYFAEMCRKNGLLASIEPYDGPFECLLAGRDADIPMGEFWVGSGESNSCKLASSVAHIYGRKLVGAESFTAAPDQGKWQNYPGALKRVGDLMYTAGINRYIVHRYAHQPWLDVYPGMTMGQWGTHFERTTTWWKQGSAWVTYLTRCQYVLQQGRFCADVCYFAGDDAPNGATHNPALKALGYDYDSCNSDVLLNRMSVKGGRIQLPDGLSYAVLVLPETTFMTPAVVSKLRDLVEAGATIIGPRPERSPSLSGFPACDATVREVAAKLWGDCDGVNVKEHAFGKGKVVWGKPLEEVLAESKTRPDVAFKGAGSKMAWIHRTTDGSDVYFVSNQKPQPVQVDCTFRVAGKRPELWRPDTGVIEPAPVWREENGLTTIPIRFDQAGSVFVVFRSSSAGFDHVVEMTSSTPGREAPKPPVVVITKARWEAVDGAGGSDVTAKVAAMAKAGENVIPANNDTFGDPTYNHVKRLRVEYAIDGKARTATVEENGALELFAEQGGGPPAYTLAPGGNGVPSLIAFEAGIYEFRTSAGKTLRAEAKDVQASVDIAGPWQVSFQSGRGAPASAAFDHLISWTESPDAGVKYFSGTAEYQTRFDVPEELVGEGRALVLDLGRVGCIAEVTLNDKPLGIWWKAPFTADVSGVVVAGRNTLKVSVTNLWANRLIGDEQFPEDREWNGKPLKAWPGWFHAGAAHPMSEARPVKERLTFTTWKHYTKDSALLDSGLMGPVTLRPAVKVQPR